jgi:hypothetical protein
MSGFYYKRQYVCFRFMSLDSLFPANYGFNVWRSPFYLRSAHKVWD